MEIEPALRLDATLSVAEALAELDRYPAFAAVAVYRAASEPDGSWFVLAMHRLRWLLDGCGPDEPLEQALDLADSAPSPAHDLADSACPADFVGAILLAGQLHGVAVPPAGAPREPAHRGDRARLGAPFEPSAGGTAAAPPAWTVVPVLFATDRDHTGDAAPGRCFGSGRGDLRFGVAEVTIPSSHRRGELESPVWWKLQFSADPNRHLTLASVSLLSRAAFVDTAQQALAAGERPELLVFVHGYNVSFENAARRTAQMAHDLRFTGVPMLYSWPSTAAVLRYTEDETNARWTATHFAQFLGLALGELGAGAVHVIAHSMGNRVVTECLRHFSPPAGAAPLRQLVLAAPDIDAQTFADLAAEFNGRAERVTLYASSRDLALKASQRVHGYPRAGDSQPRLVIVDGVDTIDASGVDTNLLGHSYIGDERSILSDLSSLIDKGEPPEQRRFHLREAFQADRRYWQFSD